MRRPVPFIMEGWSPLGGRAARSDDDYFELLCAAVFQARFRPATVRARWPTIRLVFASFSLQEVAGWPDAVAPRLLQTAGMIRSPKKIMACLRNARELSRRARPHGGVGAYLDAFAPDVEALVAELDGWASYIGAPSIRWFLLSAGVPARWAHLSAQRRAPEAQDDASR